MFYEIFKILEVNKQHGQAYILYMVGENNYFH